MVCSRGTIRRKSYRRKGYTRSSGIRVSPTLVGSKCIKDRGRKGKGPYTLPQLRKGGLRKYGWSSTSPASERLKALSKAVKKEGYSKITKRIVILANYNIRTNPTLYRKLRTDYMNLKKKYRPMR